MSPIDKEAHRRAARMQELGIREEPDPEFDEFARNLAQDLDAPFAMVNIIGPERQYFAGLYPSSLDRNVDPATDPFRTMACDHGYCMYVVTRKHAMALDEVMDYHPLCRKPRGGRDRRTRLPGCPTDRPHRDSGHHLRR